MRILYDGLKGLSGKAFDLKILANARKLEHGVRLPNSGWSRKGQPAKLRAKSLYYKNIAKQKALKRGVTVSPLRAADIL